MRVVLVNPWICDFAAANLWSAPLGLLKVAECLGMFDLKLALVDCMATWKPGRYGTGRYLKQPVDKPGCLSEVPRRFGRYGVTAEAFERELSHHAPFDIVLMTSGMSYWYPGVQKAIGTIKGLYPGVPVVLGGIYATLWHEHAATHSGADFIHKGPIDETIRFIFNTFGFRLRKTGRERPHYDLGLYPPCRFAAVLTGTGCPFRCSYCASSMLAGRFTRRDIADVIKELETLSSRGVTDFAFYDDALLADADHHIKVILRELSGRLPGNRFHCPNGLHARFLDEEVAYLMKRCGFRTIRLGLETVDRGRQLATGGKVESPHLHRAVRTLKDCGFTKRDIGVYLMYGLPGQEFREVEEGVAFLKSLGVTIHLSEFSPIPGTRSWQELVDEGVITGSIDPLLTNNTVFSYLFSGYDPAEVDKLKLQVKEYNAAPWKI